MLSCVQDAQLQGNLKGDEPVSKWHSFKIPISRKVSDLVRDSPKMAGI